ncbi:hypothetical protein GSF22_00170 [Micromonospora echinofusca]|uniref:PucR C-terminal helix-turn-helix domain-containing protein n=2 Tax=Micromonospora echinofusca TaxID=47858 RepID=A0ABS3VIT3_MICEH|nr:hypothetical protein [Micromonospora echinofusca]
MVVCGLDPEAEHVVLVSSVDAGVLAELAPGAAVAQADSGSLAIAAAGVWTGLRRRAQLVAEGLPGTRVVVAVSEPAVTANLTAAHLAARYTYTHAQARSDRITVLASTEVSSHDLLLAAVPARARQSYAARLLDPVHGYDEQHGTDLLHTLNTFLACDGSWNRTAKLLHLHVNTLRYRIGRIAALTGRDLDRFADRVDLYLALRLLPGHAVHR